MSVAVRSADRPAAERSAARPAPVAYADAPPIGELLSDVAGHAQGIVRAEVRLALEDMSERVSGGVRRAAFLGGAAVFGVLGVILLLVGAMLALATVVALWLAAVIVAAVAFVGALMLIAAARRPSDAADAAAAGSVS